MINQMRAGGWELQPMGASGVPLGLVKHLNHGDHMWVTADGRPAGRRGRAALETLQRADAATPLGLAVTHSFTT